ncbi:hypothetical protein UG56_014730 [Nocardioides luteus]|uniref:Uncharacterized protein n=1 Tax=Nocardioides luteus TaxID=1844 RepID=A0A1J4N5Z9_9ACTN|nr:hypothetical protein UG56_014730 [Nocardioides luteus]
MLAAVAVALFGLLSMHGWGTHAGGAGAHDMSVMTAGGHEAAQVLPAGHGEADSPGAHISSGVPVDGEGGGLLGLCLAILGGLMLAVALFLARRGIRLLRSLLPAWPGPVFYGRDRDPPDLLQLCVIRC